MATHPNLLQNDVVQEEPMVDQFKFGTKAQPGKWCLVQLVGTDDACAFANQSPLKAGSCSEM